MKLVVLVFLALSAALTSGSYRIEAHARSLPPGERITELRAAQLVRPGSPRLHRAVASAYLDLGRPADAVHELQWPFLTHESRRLLVRAQIATHSYAGAARSAGGLSGADRARARAYAALAAGDRAGATSLARSLGSSDPLDRRLQGLLALPDASRAAPLFPKESPERKLLEATGPSEANRQLASSEIYERAGLIRLAENSARSATTAAPASPGAWSRLATLQLQNRDAEAALESLAHATALDPIDPELYRLQARAYLAIGEKAKADSAEAHAASLRPAR